MAVAAGAESAAEERGAEGMGYGEDPVDVTFGVGRERDRLGRPIIRRQSRLHRFGSNACNWSIGQRYKQKTTDR